jgi:hypothetical protein
MKHAILLAVALALVAPADASAQSKEKSAASPAASPQKSGTKGSAPTTASSSSTKSQQKAKKETAPSVPPERLAAVNRAKSVFIFAVETCDRPERCDPSLRADAERRFLDACRLCASAERCEAERDTIRAGQGESRTNPCLE